MKQDDLDELIAREARLKSYSKDDEVILSLDLEKILRDRMTEQPEVEMKSGFDSLDAAIHHFLGGELIVVSGPTKMGKTLLAQTLTRNFYSQGKPSLWFSYEVPAYQFLKQFGDNPPVFAIPKQLKDNSFTWIQERVHEAKLKYDIAAVFIDNTHNIVNLTSQNLAQVMGEFLKASKRMALDYNVAVFLLHHMSKIKLDDGENLGSHLLRDSSMVAQTADTVMFVWRDKDPVLNPNRSYLKVTENRRYGVFNHIVHLIKIGNFLEECEIHHGK